MPKIKRPVRERTEDWAQLRLLVTWPEQMAYELIRPVVLYGETAAERARDTGEHERTIDRKADSFDRQGMLELFPAQRREPVEDPRSLPPPMRQLIVDLHTEVPEMSLRELAQVCYVRFGRRPSHLTVKKVLAAGPAPSVTTRRYAPYYQIPDAVQRRFAIVRLHAEGWRVSTIARYLGTTRHTVYDTLKRWVGEQFAGMPDRSRAPRQPATKATLGVVNEIRKLQENPELGEWRVHAALLQVGIHVSPSTCGRIMRPVWAGPAEALTQAEEGDAVQGEQAARILVARHQVHREAQARRRQAGVRDQRDRELQPRASSEHDLSHAGSHTGADGTI